MKNLCKFFVLLLPIAVLALVAGTPIASAQGGIPAPTNLNAYDGAATGEVVITWNAVPNANFYRVGWVAFDDYQEAQAAGRDWLEAFAFVDVQNRGQTSHTVKRLTPGTLYAFIVATNNSRYGQPNYPQQWARLTLSGTAPVCPIGEPTPPQPRPSPTGSVAGDRAALVALYNATGGANWLRNGNWGTDAPLNQWRGVFTNADGRVTDLKLEGAGLTGRLPAEIGNLSALDYLLLRENRFSGPIPTELGNLAKLEFLDIGHNQLTGPIPESIGRLSNLNAIYLAQNQLTGTVPDEFGNLTQLDSLSLDDNRLVGTVPSTLGNLTNLRLLDLHDNSLTGQIPASLAGITGLGWLNLARNQLTGSIPASLGSLSMLGHLRLQDNRLSGRIPSQLGNLSNLSTLRLSGNNLVGCVPASLSDVQDNDFRQLGLPFC